MVFTYGTTLSCSYCKSQGHTKSNCLKLLTKVQEENSSICRDYNRYLVADCETNGFSNECTGHRLHQCSLCGDINCKAYFHVHRTSSNHGSNSSPTSELPEANSKVLNSLVELLGKLVSNMEKLQNEIRNTLPTNTETIKAFKPHDILVTDVIFGNKTVHLPMSNKFPFSCVSEEFSKELMNSVHVKPSNQLPSNIPWAFIAENKVYRPTQVVQVPVTWTNGHSSSFAMLVVPGLPFKVIFGDNHLQKTESDLDLTKNSIYFKHKDMNFCAYCRTCPSDQIKT